MWQKNNNKCVVKNTNYNIRCSKYCVSIDLHNYLWKILKGLDALSQVLFKKISIFNSFNYNNNYKYIILILLHLSNKKQYICNVLFGRLNQFYNRCMLKIVNKYTNLFV